MLLAGPRQMLAVPQSAVPVDRASAVVEHMYGPEESECYRYYLVSASPIALEQATGSGFGSSCLALVGTKARAVVAGTNIEKSLTDVEILHARSRSLILFYR